MISSLFWFPSILENSNRGRLSPSDNLWRLICRLCEKPCNFPRRCGDRCTLGINEGQSDSSCGPVKQTVITGNNSFTRHTVAKMLIADVKNKYVRMIRRSETRGISLKTSINIFFPKCICFEHIFTGKWKENKIFFAVKPESPWLLSSLIQRCLFQADFFLDLCVIIQHWKASSAAVLKWVTDLLLVPKGNST